MKTNYKEEYFLLKDLLEEVNAGLRGECEDIDCDKFISKDLLKKKYKAVLEHNFSCLGTLKREKRVLESLLILSQYKKYRYKKCKGCKETLDELSNTATIVSFTRPIDNGNYEWKGFWVHKKCQKKVKAPKNFSKM